MGHMLKKTPFIIGRAGLCLVISLLTLVSQADISVPSLFSDHMVLQQEKPVRIWGWADPGESVKLHLEGIAAETITGEDGKWMVQLPPIPAGGPYSLVISGNNEITINDVLVGEVWVASGQSNMQWTSNRSTNADLDRLRARRAPQIRFNQVRNMGSQTPQYLTDKVWEGATGLEFEHLPSPPPYHSFTQAPPVK